MIDYGYRSVRISEIRENVDKLNALMKELEDRFTDDDDLQRYLNPDNDSIDPGDYYDYDEFDRELAIKVRSVLGDLVGSFGLRRLR